jgi:hypothetical protein
LRLSFPFAVGRLAFDAGQVHDGVLAGLNGTLPARGDNVVGNGDFFANADDWSASGGALSVGAAVDRDGAAACVTARTQTSDGLSQANLLMPSHPEAPSHSRLGRA